MKTRRFFALFIIFALALSLCAHADIAYEPFRDDFYSKHYEECEHHDHWYHVNGVNGYVTVYSSPTGSAVVNIPNGREFRVGATWSKGTDGKTWACIEYDPETLENDLSESESGWLDMGELLPRYGNQEFFSEHEGKLQHSIYTIFIEEGKELLAYRYPGSGIIEYRFPYIEDIENAMSTEYLYTDAEGREWGYVGYHYGRVNAWICISDPYTELPAGPEYRAPELIPAADEETLKSVPLTDGGLSGSVIAGIAGVLIIAAAVVVYIVLKKRRET